MLLKQAKSRRLRARAKYPRMVSGYSVGLRQVVTLESCFLKIKKNRPAVGAVFLADIESLL